VKTLLDPPDPVGSGGCDIDSRFAVDQFDADREREDDAVPDFPATGG
jgi:hypothetical protein